MAPKKLTEADKKAILGLYREPAETTSTLADRYGVSNSTISRLLKASLPEAEYSLLIQQKRSAGDKGSMAPVAEPVTPPEEATPTEPRSSVKAPVLKSRERAEPAPTAPISEAIEAPAEAKPAPARRVRSRTKSESEPLADTQLTLATEAPAPAADSPPLQPLTTSAAAYNPSDVEADLEEEAWDDASPLDDDDYDEEDDEEDDDEGWEGEAPSLAPQLEALEIYPLTAQALPPLCYLVVERVSSELVALPLRTFASLGQIPEEEGESRTLPVFDNHRIARRFSRRNQRVIKVPDGALLQTTSPYLQAKGITRLLIDGQVFALEDQPRTDRTEAEVSP